VRIRSRTSTASATDSPTLVSAPDSSPHALELRLLLSYLAAFALTIVVSAFVMRTAFVRYFQFETDTRLQTLARAGLRSLLPSTNGLAVDRREISNIALLTKDQGLQWFDSDRKLVADEGIVPNVPAPETDGGFRTGDGNQEFNTFSLPILDAHSGARVGTVRASESAASQDGSERWLDTGLAIGTLAALVGGALGGLALARRAVAPVEATFAKLREFTADAAHELRSPLTAIGGNADAALREEERDPERDLERFLAIRVGVDQMARLTSDLLLLAGSERSLEREMFVVDLSVMVRDLSSRFGPRFQAAGLALHVSRDGRDIVYGNPDQIERIFANLIENALRYTPSGGFVSIETTRDPRRVSITVRDNGIGIEPQHLDRVFDRFWRADPARSHGGSGLGLAIALALARRHGGDVTVESTHNRGSAFTVTLPTRPPRA
jgi:signal transduction histidine kinase